MAARAPLSRRRTAAYPTRARIALVPAPPAGDARARGRPSAPELIGRLAAGFLLAAAIAAVARATRSLSTSGAIAAVLVGTSCVAAGWSWGLLLIAFFVTSTVLSRAGRAEKERRTGDVVAKGGERDAAQVLANGGLYAAAALGSLLLPWPGWPMLGAGALAAATADTWSTEIGTLARRPPRSIITWRPMPTGMSGGVSAPGTLAALAGAGCIALLARAMGWPPRVAAGAVVGGFAGGIVDSLLGATVQARRRCPRCETITERDVHGCGTPTLPAGGIPWLDNDRVNILSVLAGALVAAAVGL